MGIVVVVMAKSDGAGGKIKGMEMEMVAALAWNGN